MRSISFLGNLSSFITYSKLGRSNPKLFNESRMMRIARWSERVVGEVMEMLEEYKKLEKIWSKMKGLKIPKNGDMSVLSKTHERSAHQQGPPSSYAQADWWHGVRLVAWVVCRVSWNRCVRLRTWWKCSVAKTIVYFFLTNQKLTPCSFVIFSFYSLSFPYL